MYRNSHIIQVCSLFSIPPSKFSELAPLCPASNLPQVKRFLSIFLCLKLNGEQEATPESVGRLRKLPLTILHENKH